MFVSMRSQPYRRSTGNKQILKNGLAIIVAAKLEDPANQFHIATGKLTSDTTFAKWSTLAGVITGTLNFE